MNFLVGRLSRLVTYPIFHTSTFVFRSAQDGKEFFELAYGLRQKRPNEEPGLIYSRINNPDLEMLEDRLAIWDQAESSLVFASGMAAISTTLWAYARPGTVIIRSGPVYGGTDFLLNKILRQFGVTSIGFLSEGGNRAMEGSRRLMSSIIRRREGLSGALIETVSRSAGPTDASEKPAGRQHRCNLYRIRRPSPRALARAWK